MGSLNFFIPCSNGDSAATRVRDISDLFPFMIAFNILMIISTVPIGGHYLADICHIILTFMLSGDVKKLTCWKHLIVQLTIRVNR